MRKIAQYSVNFHSAMVTGLHQLGLSLRPWAQRYAPAGRKAFWLLMLACHAPAILGLATGLLTTGDVDPVRVIGLSASVAFFALKLADVRWLRFRPGWRSWFVLALVVALIHAEGLGITVHGRITPQILAVLSGSLLLEPVQRRVDRLLHAVLPAEPARTGRARPRIAWIDAATEQVARLPQWLLTHVAAPPRAPPV